MCRLSKGLEASQSIVATRRVGGKTVIFRCSWLLEAFGVPQSSNISTLVTCVRGQPRIFSLLTAIKDPRFGQSSTDI